MSNLEFEEIGQYGFDRDETELEKKFPYLKDISYSKTSFAEDDTDNSEKFHKKEIFGSKEDILEKGETS